MTLDNMIQNNTYSPTKPFDCTCDECKKEFYQYADISLPIEIKPTATIGKIETECCEEPTIVCHENKCSNTCEVIITQKVSIKIPITYSVISCAGESAVKCCAEDSCGE